jgi:RecA/RadA recombinase
MNTLLLRALPIIALTLLAACWVTVWRAGRRQLPQPHQLTPHGGARQIRIIPPPDAPATGGTVLWTHLADLAAHGGHRSHLAFEYLWSQHGVQISLWVPGSIPVSAVAEAVRAAWPGAHTDITHPQPPLATLNETSAEVEDGVVEDDVPDGTGRCTVRSGLMRLARPDSLPLRTNLDPDPLRALFHTAHPHAQGSQAVVQILARPATPTQLARAVRAAQLLRSGRPLSPAARLLDILYATKTQAPERPAQLRAVLDKAAYPRMETIIRFAVSGPDDAALAGRAAAIAAAFSHFGGPHNHLRPSRLQEPAQALAERAFTRGQLLSAPELGALAHLPLDQAVQGLVRAGARTVPPSPAIPGPSTAARPIGRCDSGVPRGVALPVDGARHHVHVAGATGSGKTTLLTHWILNDAAAGRGVVVIDGKGDQTLDILDRLPTHTIDRVTLIDPAQAGPPPGINVLHGPDPYLAVDHLVAIFHQMYADSWGPRTDDILRAACLTLAHHNNPARQHPDGHTSGHVDGPTGGPADGPIADPMAGHACTLADVPRLLAEPAYRARITAALSDPVLTQFWAWYEQLSAPGRAAAIGPVNNKLRALLLRPFVRAVIAQPATVVDLGQILDGGILLVRIPKGELGADTVRLLGSFLIAALWEHLTYRTRQGETARKDAAIYVDEIHNYLGLLTGFEDLLAEARAFHLSLVLAHQNLAQIPRDLRETLSANARNKIYFQTSPEDARAYQRHVEPDLTVHDLVHLDAFQAVARLIIGHAITPAFTLRTDPLPPPIPGRAEQIRHAAAARSAQFAATGTAALDRSADDPRRRTPAGPSPMPPGHHPPRTPPGQGGRQ